LHDRCISPAILHTICYYCACNKIITKDHGRSAKYLKYLARELALANRLSRSRRQRCRTVALGRRHADLPVARRDAPVDGGDARGISGCSTDGEYSIEVDPRKVDRATVDLLANLVSTA
jgi:oxygen-independent coproporphyrinogen-3 oxidase